jgi:hypothetical protein
VALSADGDVAVVGDPGNGVGVGAVWVFTRSGSTWSEQEQFTDSDQGEEAYAFEFGESVALSADGNTALIGGSGAAWVFTHPVPAVVTGAASLIGESGVRLSATVDPNGGAVSECWFEYGPTTSYGSRAPCPVWPGSGTGAVAVSASVEGLSANTTYHFRISAANPAGTGYGNDETFQTPPVSPTVTTIAASSVGQDYATLNATVNPNGGQITACRFEYGTSVSYGSSALCSSTGQVGVGPVAVSGTIHVSANTNYHYRIVATNAGGTSYGGDQAFTTPLPPLPRVEASMTWSFAWSKRYTIVRSLIAHAVPRGAYVEVSCKGRGCPFAHDRTATVAASKDCHGKKCLEHRVLEGPTVSLASLFKGRHLGVGARISVSMIRSGWVGKSFVFTVRTESEPASQIACLAPGSNTPGRGC